MKLTLKEFFLREEKSSSSSKHSSVNIDVKSSAQVNIKENEDCSSMDEHGDPTKPVDKGASIWSDPSQPADVRKFTNRGGNLHVDLKEMFGDMDEAGPKTVRTPADPKSLPDEPDDSWFTGADALGAGEPKPDQPADPSGFEPVPDDDPFADREGDDTVDWATDPAFGGPKKAPEPDPLAKFDFTPDQPKDKGQFWRDAEKSDADMWSFDQLRDEDPEVAAEIEREFPDLTEPGFVGNDPTGSPRERSALFFKDPAGDIEARIHGSRYRWDRDGKSWIPLDGE